MSLAVCAKRPHGLVTPELNSASVRGNEPKAKAARLMEKHWPTYEKELVEGNVLPGSVVQAVRRKLPAVWIVDPPRITKVHNILSSPVTIAKVCTSKKLMSLLYSLVANGEVKWDVGNKFMAHLRIHLAQQRDNFANARCRTPLGQRSRGFGAHAGGRVAQGAQHTGRNR